MAVYTRLTHDTAQDIATAYGIGNVVALREIAEGIENSNFLLITEQNGTQTNHILTIFEKRTNPQDLPFFLGLMEHFAQAGIPCPTPLHLKNNTMTFDYMDKTGALVSFLDGKSVLAAHTSEDMFRQLGTMIGKMQLAGKDFKLTRANSLGLEGWKALSSKIDTRADEIEIGLTQCIQDELIFLEKHWPHGLPQGIIHADIFPDNVFFQGDTLSGIIDFYFSCYDALLYEIAIVLNAWCFDAQNVYQASKADALLSAYHDICPLSQAEKESLTLLCRGAALRFLLTRAYDWLNHDARALVTRKDPLEYVAKLKYWQSVL
jgi:homoserine kinase type II